MSRLEEIKRVVESQKEAVRKLSHNDLNWLIQQADTLCKIAESWIDIEANGSEADAVDFYTVVQDILSDNENSEYPLKPVI